MSEDKKQLVAWIEIWHPASNTRIATIKEPCPSHVDALEQFNNLHKVISSWANEYQGILLDTELGMLRLPSNLIAGSILQIKVDYIESETDTEDSLND
jgi:hypothetical protein